ncbi:MAG: hypothetical protein KDA99_21570, partial [Planctomycetales bacterium]|nr:hypothetical protein [Planctomycetales bacterium]
FLAIWLIFALAMAIMRIITDAVSKHQVRFKAPVEHVGRLLFPFLTGWVLVCLACASLHTAPLARTAFKGSFQPEYMSKNFLFLAPDRMWLGFVQSRSAGALSVNDPDASSPYPEDQGKRIFDPAGEFVAKYGQRRADLEALNEKNDSIRVKK